MRIAFISDIHANLPALEAVIADAREHGATHLLCLGDIVGYGPQPAKTLERIREVASGVLLGNHDAAAAEILDLSCFNPFAKETAARAILALDDEAKSYLRGLPHLLEVKNIACSHSCFDSPETYRYLESKEDAARSLAAMPKFTLLVVGHTHVPSLFEQAPDGSIHTLPPKDTQLRAGCRYVVNPGSVGFPRTDTLTADYLIYDTLMRKLVFRSIVYDLTPYRLALVRNGYNPLNYWFLSPSARKRRNELALCNPPSPASEKITETAGFRPLPKKRPLRHWLFGVCVIALLIMTTLSLVLTTSPTPPPETTPQVYYNPANLLAPLQQWIMPEGAYCSADPAENEVELHPLGIVSRHITLLSPPTPVPNGCKKLRFSFKTVSNSKRKKDKEDYTVFAEFTDETGMRWLSDEHAYKSAKRQSFTIPVPAKAKNPLVRLQFNFTVKRLIKLQTPELEVSDE